MNTFAVTTLLVHPVQYLSELSMLAFLPLIAGLLVATIAADRAA